MSGVPESPVLRTSMTMRLFIKFITEITGVVAPVKEIVIEAEAWERMKVALQEDQRMVHYSHSEDRPEPGTFRLAGVVYRKAESQNVSAEIDKTISEKGSQRITQREHGINMIEIEITEAEQ